MASGVFIGADIVNLRFSGQEAITSVSDLLLFRLDELAAIVGEKGGSMALLDDMWQKVYKTAARGLFAKGEMQVA